MPISHIIYTNNFKKSEKLELCIGSTVMLLNNLGTEVGLTNGTLGKLIAHIRIDSKTLLVSF